MTQTAVLLLAIGVVVMAILYWQLILTEGALIGQWLVTWLYDIAAPKYDVIKQYDSETEAHYLGGPLASALRGQATSLLLDVGSGTGRLADALLNQPSFQGRIICLDASRPMLIRGARKLAVFSPARVSFVLRDGISLPFDTACFDAVTCLEMLEFTPDPAQQVDELLRVLRPGGLLVLTRRRSMPSILMPGKIHDEQGFANLLYCAGCERVEVQAWQVDYDLFWAWKPANEMIGSRPMIEVLRCPACSTTGFWEDQNHAILCGTCGALYERRDDIIDMRD